CCVPALAARGAPARPPPPGAAGDPLPPGAVARLGSTRWRHSGTVTFVHFLPDSKTLLSAGRDGTVRLWEVATGKQVRCIRIAEDGREPAAKPDYNRIPPSLVVAVSPHPRTLATRSPG